MRDLLGSLSPGTRLLQVAAGLKEYPGDKAIPFVNAFDGPRVMVARVQEILGL